MVKGGDKFALKHTDSQSRFDEFIAECTSFECPRPSSYSSVFHSVFRTARIPYSVNMQFAHSFAGGWEQARQTGTLSGSWRKYDLNSAYLWASTLGLPRPSTFKYASKIAKRPGLYHIELAAQLDHLPYPYNTRRFVNATDDEINLYSLPIRRIIGGVTWEDSLPEDVVSAVVSRFSFAKEVSKSYWGRWCSTETIRCTVGAKHWELPNPCLNLVWAHLLIGRVRARVWQEAASAAHVFVDSIITTDALKVGTGLGSWRLDAEYPDGVKVRHAGFYGPANSDKWDRTSGTKSA